MYEELRHLKESVERAHENNYELHRKIHHMWVICIGSVLIATIAMYMSMLNNYAIK